MLLLGFRVSEIFDQTVAAIPLPGGLALESIPAHSPLPSAFGSAGLFDRSSMVHTTSLRPALRQEPLSHWYRGNNPPVQTIGFNYSR
jgi:hypothetical protein